MAIQTGKFFKYTYLYDDRELEISEIDTITTDDQVKSKLNIRTANMLDYKGSFVNSEDINDELLKNLNNYFREYKRYIANFITKAMSYGAGALEFIWQERTYNLQSLLFHKVGYGENLYFDLLDDQLKANTGEDIDTSYKFLIYEYDKDADAPHGRSIFTKTIYNWVVFKKRCIILLDQLLDKFGVPSVVALLKDTRNMDEMQTYIDALSEEIEALRSGAGITIGNVESLETLQASGSAVDFEKSINLANTAISNLILGSGRTTDTQTKGAYSSDKTAESVIDKIAKSDNEVFEFYLNQFFNWIIKVNYRSDIKVNYEYDRGERYEFDHLLKAVQVGDKNISLEQWSKFVPRATNPSDILTIEQPQTQQFEESKKKILKLNI